MVTTLSREMTLSCSSPFVVPTGSSLLSPLAARAVNGLFLSEVGVGESAADEEHA